MYNMNLNRKAINNNYIISLKVHMTQNVSLSVF